MFADEEVDEIIARVAFDAEYFSSRINLTAALSRSIEPPAPPPIPSEPDGWPVKTMRCAMSRSRVPKLKMSSPVNPTAFVLIFPVGPVCRLPIWLPTVVRNDTGQKPMLMPSYVGRSASEPN